jgi:hypothetical protein
VSVQAVGLSVNVGLDVVVGVDEGTGAWLGLEWLCLTSTARMVNTRQNMVPWGKPDKIVATAFSAVKQMMGSDEHVNAYVVMMFEWLTAFPCNPSRRNIVGTER